MAFLVLAGALPAGAVPPAATTTISNVRALRVGDDAPAMLLYDVRHEASGEVPRGGLLPGAHVRAADHPDAFRGVWGPDGGDVGAWLGAPMQWADQFVPRTTYAGDVFFENRLAPDLEDYYRLSLPMEAGDHGDLVVGEPAGNVQLPWDRERSTGPGTLDWELTVDSTTISAEYGVSTGEADVVTFRAHLVARGGDVDATAGPIAAPPLVIDLGQKYPTETEASYLVTLAFPHTQYVSPSHTRTWFQVHPQLGTAVLQASARGYVFEARERTLPNGGVVNEWHLPFTGIISLKREADPLPARAAAQLPSGGRVMASDGVLQKTLDVAPGGRVVGGSGLLPEGGRGEAAPAAAASPGPDLDAASAIDETLSSPVTLTTGNGRFDVTIDPDFRGEGILAVKSVQNHASGRTLASVAAVPYVEVDERARGKPSPPRAASPPRPPQGPPWSPPVKLDRSRLIDLSVLPLSPAGGIGHIGTSTHRPLTRVQTLFSDVYTAGFTLRAVYDLGAGRYAFVMFEAHRSPLMPPTLVSSVRVRSVTGEPVTGWPIHYQEIPEVGPVTIDGTTYAEELTTRMPDYMDGTEIRIGDHSYQGSLYLEEGGHDRADVTIVDASAPLTANPEPAPGRSIAGVPLALYMTSPLTTVQDESMLVAYSHEPEPSASPRPLGMPCGTPQVTDLPDAPPALDVRSAWLDADAANVYATIAVADVPAAVAKTHAWTFHWRHDHRGNYARAVLDPQGRWSFETGYANQEPQYSNQPLFYIKAVDVTGDVRTGPGGFVRIAIPRSFLTYVDGDMMRQTAAFGQVLEGQVPVDVDAAPTGTTHVQGSGGDYVVGSCS